MNTDTSSAFEIRTASSEQLDLMGGKAASLARLLQNNFPVPPGISILDSKISAQDFQWIRSWASAAKIFPVAVRSSAQGEDGAEVSYAGQFKTFLNVQNEDELLKAIQDCFDSVTRYNSQAYASHFERPEIPMRVLVQKMIQPQFSGVYFSKDPRQQVEGWMFEAVRGLGEQLVSGQVTPFRYFQNENQDFDQALSQKNQKEIVFWAQKVEELFGYQIDMEWAIDAQDNFWILQVRPITTLKKQAPDFVAHELHRLQSTYAADTVWDGHSFAELSGIPSEMSFAIWEKSFSPNHAFDQALRDLGYSGLATNSTENQESLLNRVFGRSYLNLKKMEPIYFGQSPYKIVPEPRPHLEFDWHRLSPKLLLRAPVGIGQMLQVAWKIQTERSAWIDRALKSVDSNPLHKLSAPEIYSQTLARAPEQQWSHFVQLLETLTKNDLYGTFLITLLIESTTQAILALLTKDLGDVQALEELPHFLGEKLQTVSSEMSHQLHLATLSETAWNEMRQAFGHRGIGELELTNPRWMETLFDSKKSSSSSKTLDSQATELKKEEIISRLSALRKPIFLQEIKEMEKLLQAREVIKNQLMKTYSDLRWTLNQIGIQTEIGPRIFWLQPAEVEKLLKNSKSFSELQKLAEERKLKAQSFKSIQLPLSFSNRELQSLLNPTDQSAVRGLKGVSLSPGLASGVVHLVEDPEKEDLSLWPENTILVTEATDPGWTPLFEKAAGIIVARGGILSHCAILAREMGIPAVGEIHSANLILKEGEHVWVDGIHGTVQRAH